VFYPGSRSGGWEEGILHNTDLSSGLPTTCWVLFTSSSTPHALFVCQAVGHGPWATTSSVLALVFRVSTSDALILPVFPQPL
jgi:hypothetical protein